MSTETAETVVRLSIVVQAPIERAFRVFIEDFSGGDGRIQSAAGLEPALP